VNPLGYMPVKWEKSGAPEETDAIRENYNSISVERFYQESVVASTIDPIHALYSSVALTMYFLNNNNIPAYLYSTLFRINFLFNSALDFTKDLLNSLGSIQSSCSSEISATGYTNTDTFSAG
jgi:hypothetical protein